MKTVHKLVVVFVVLIILFLVGAYMLPSELHITKSVFIRSSPEVIFEQVNNLKNWEKWSPWENIDTTMDLKYFGNPTGEGSGFEWKSDNSDVGSGRLIIDASKPYDSINTEIELGRKEKGIASFLFQKNDTGSFITWDFRLNLGNNPFSRYFGLFRKGKLEDSFQLGLLSLKKVSENMTISLSLKIFQMKFGGFTYLGIREKVNPSEMVGKTSKSIRVLRDYISKKELKITLSPFRLFNSISKKEIDLTTGIPVEKADSAQDSIIVGHILPCKVAFVNYIGSYSGLNNGHEAIKKWIDVNKRKIIGSPFELYITDSLNEKDSTRWLTKIFYPIE
jgi:effector-binding domain-containing protein